MPRHYTPQDRQFALDRVTANHGDVNRTATELGIHPATLYKWQKKAKFAISLSSFSSPISPNDSHPPYEVGTRTRLGDGDKLPADDLQTLINFKTRLIEAADYISLNIIPAVESAPLGQRVVALTQLMNYVGKLAAQLSTLDERVEYIAYEKDETDETTTDNEASQETVRNPEL